MSSGDIFLQIDKNWRLVNGVIYSRLKGKPIKFYKNNKGYLQVTVNIRGACFSVTQHDAVWMLKHKKPIPKGLEIHHIDHNRQNNKPENLMLIGRSLHSLYHKMKQGSKGYCYLTSPIHHRSPWGVDVYLPNGFRIRKVVPSEDEAIKLVEYHRRPIIKALNKIGLYID